VRKSAPPVVQSEVNGLQMTRTEDANAPQINCVVPSALHVVSATVGRNTLPFLVDEFAHVSAVRLDVLKSFGLSNFVTEPISKIASSHDTHVLGKAIINFKLGNFKIWHEFLVVDLANTSWFAILGGDFLMSHSATVRDRTLQFPTGAVPVVKRSFSDSINSEPSVLENTRSNCKLLVSDTNTSAENVARGGKIECASRSNGDQTIIAHAQLARTGSQRPLTFSTLVRPTSASPDTNVGVSFSGVQQALELAEKRGETAGFDLLSTGLSNQAHWVQPGRSSGAEVPPPPPPMPRDMQCNDKSSPMLRRLLTSRAKLCAVNKGAAEMNSSSSKCINTLLGRQLSKPEGNAGQYATLFRRNETPNCTVKIEEDFEPRVNEKGVKPRTHSFRLETAKDAVICQYCEQAGHKANACAQLKELIKSKNVFRETL